MKSDGDVVRFNLFRYIWSFFTWIGGMIVNGVTHFYTEHTTIASYIISVLIASLFFILLICIW